MQGRLQRWVQLCRLFARQDLAARFEGNVGGLLWALLAPLLQLAIFYLVFAQIFKARIPGLEGLGYVAFLALGFWPWFALSESIARGASTYVEHAGLVRKVAVSLSALVMARVLAAFLLHGLGFLAVLLMLGLLGVRIDWTWLPAVIALWVPLLALAAGMALLVASAQVFIRDLAQALGLALSLWFFLTPIIYARDMVPDWLQPALDLNPMTGMVEAHRHLLLGTTGDVPWLAMAAGAGVLVLLGVFVHRRCRPAIEDFL